MNHLFTFCLLSSLIPPSLWADEITVESHPFTIEKSFPATILPDEGSVLLQLEPKTWTDFKIVDLAAHGTRVAKGDLLVSFNPEAIDKMLADARSSLASSALTLAQAESDLKHLETTSPHMLLALQRAAEIAEEENSYFTNTRRKATEDSATQALERKKQMLENHEEELKQLAEMYKADDLTENTEEIILTRQKNDVTAAKLVLRMGALSHERTLKVTLPREAVDLATEQRNTRIALLKAETDIPRSIELKKVEIESLRTGHQRAEEHLAELEADRTLFDIKAPTDGYFYHGPIKDGRWSPAKAVKTLVAHGRPALNQPFATLVPSNSTLTPVALLEQSTASTLSKGLTGIASPSGREDLEIPVTLKQLATIPSPGGTYRADFTATWPDGFSPAIGSSVTVRLITYHQDAAIALPSETLSYGPKGWTLEVKLTDGKSERRPVKRGRVSGDKTEILSGLEAGQVILTD